MQHIPLWNGYFKIRGNKENPTLNVIKLELTYTPVECWIIYPYVHWFFD